ncbi:uncharacterized protein FOMMEDRAFT_168982 [Fomitiporia mediterranea MF3/22]|uniref:uncharacterized protein n=1 Tax=Fomitiporia mediterranea (strain MF3/22) TaxID=694068 RepID=UPI0004409852|nr:uncharacterized protein FOMMEDRAFT_168982 [Fomitiporia mediterranea MF3/22]EJD00707.1 hypothetical protein FOMMEDRAFT_168982 [Fomitiporia mediterranea MF3/22]
MPFCHFDVLAPELVQLIFSFCVERRDGHFIEYNNDTPPLVLLRVCRRWQYIAFQTPGLFDSISLRRRVHAPFGFDFARDTQILQHFLNLPRPGYRNEMSPRQLEVQLCYGDIKRYGNTLMWTDLLSMVRKAMELTDNLGTLYLRFPDDCMEKFLMKICSDSGDGIQHANLRSISLHSTREGLLIPRYLSWWYDQETNFSPQYYHKLDTRKLPSLKELGLHFPGPLTLDPICRRIEKLHVSVFKWEQLEEYLTGCPNVVDLTIEFREPLAGQDWAPYRSKAELTFPRLRALEIRSALVGQTCANKLLRFFLVVHMPNLKTLRLRRLPQADRSEPPNLCYGTLIMRILKNLEELELIDFPPEPCGNWDIGPVFSAAPKLRRLAYREVEMISCPEYFRRLISHLMFSSFEPPAPRLQILELDAIHLRQGENVILQDLLQLIATRRVYNLEISDKLAGMMPDFPARASALQRICLPPGCSDALRRIDMHGLAYGIDFDFVPMIEELSLEDDLNEEGPERRNRYEWTPLRWKTPASFCETASTTTCNSPSSLFSAASSFTQKRSLQPMDSILEVEQMLFPTTGDGNDGSGMSRASSQNQSYALTHLHLPFFDIVYRIFGLVMEIAEIWMPIPFF